MSLGKTKMQDAFTPGAVLKSKRHGRVSLNYNWRVRCVRRGEVIWEDVIPNRVVNSGLQASLGSTLGKNSADQYSAQISNWYVGLLKTGFSAIVSTTSLSDLVSAGEFSAYTGTNRIAFNPDPLSGQTLDNADSTANFTISASTACGGAFLTSIQVRSATSSGGVLSVLFAAGAFTGGDRTGLQSDDQLQVTAEFSAADDAG